MNFDPNKHISPQNRLYQAWHCEIELFRMKCATAMRQVALEASSMQKKPGFGHGKEFMQTPCNNLRMNL